MSVTTATPTPTSSGSDIPEKTLLAGMALASFSALSLELALTRLFSVVLFYHFAFLAVSIALLGLGAGGVFAYLRRQQLGRFPTPQLGAQPCLLNALSIVVALQIVLHVPVSLVLSGHNFFRRTALYCAATV